MKNLEIEKKYLIYKNDLILDYKKYPYVKIEQRFIYLKPAIRIRKMDDKYFLTIKSKPPKKYSGTNDLVRTEFEIEISKKAYLDLAKLCKTRTLSKTRYLIPYKQGRKTYKIELDIFEKELKGLIYAEIEFSSVKDAETFVPPSWFSRDVTGIEKYKNTQLSICKIIKKATGTI